MAGKPSMKQLIFLQLVAWLGWLSAIALAQFEFSEAVTGSANITDLGITCLANGAVFFASLLRGRLYLEMGARDVMATIRDPELKDIEGLEGVGLSTGEIQYASVVMLSNDTSNSSITQFMKYIYNTHDVYTILLKFLPYREAFESEPELVNAECHCENCNCIVFRTKNEITEKLVPLVPGTLKRLHDRWCLLPCGQCLRDLCHRCNESLLHLDELGSLTNGNPMVENPAAVCEALNSEFMTANQRDPICICIPLHHPAKDDWTKLLMKSFKSKDQQDRGAISMASDALENYLSGNQENETEEELYRTGSLIVPKIVEISINFLLTFWIKVDGFSSAMVARKAVKNHVLNSTGDGFAAIAFLTGALVKYNGSNNTVCQVLRFRGGTLLTLKSLSCIVGFFNLIFSIAWAVLVAIGGRDDKWYEITSRTPSKPRIAVIIAAICIGSIMDILDLFTKEDGGTGRSLMGCSEFFCEENRWRPGLIPILAVIILEIACIVSVSAVLGTLGIKEFGRWVYSALQGLVWIKWGIGCYLLGEYSPGHVRRRSSVNTSGKGPETLRYSSARWLDHGTLVYSSAFFFNAVLAGVRGWK